MNFKHKVVKTLVAVGLVLSMTTGLAMASVGTGIVTASSLRLRSEPTTSSRILTSASKGSKVEILEGQSDGWYKVSYNNVVGYMSAEWLNVTQTSEEDNGTAAETKQGTVNAGPLNVRSGPGTSYKKVGSLKKGAAVTIVETAGSWYKITSGSVSGYVSATYITLSTVVTGSTNISPDSGASATDETQGRVNTASLNVRSGPGTSYARIGSLKLNTLVNIVSSANGWYQITTNSISGYVSADYITLGSDPLAEPEEGMITHAALNVRTGPGTSYTKISSLSRGTIVKVLDKVNGWYKISYGSVTGYVSGSYVIILESSPSTSRVGQAAAAMAASLIGCKYVYGAEGPSTFDCSGLSYYIFKQLGYTLSRGSSGQYQNNGVFVSRNDIQPGDLVFFFDAKYDNSGGTLPTTHMGIYVGNNQFIHASTTTRTVKYSDLFGGYYESRIVGFKRIG